MKRTATRVLCLSVMAILCVTGMDAANNNSSRRGEVSNAVAVVEINSPTVHMFTDKLTYQPGEPVILKGGITPNGDPNPYTFFVYLENLETGARLYHPTYTVGAVNDMYGGTLTERPLGAVFPVLYNVPDAPDFLGMPVFGPGGFLGDARTAPAEPGNYRYVMELRNAGGTEIASQAFAPFDVVSETETLSGDITANRTLSHTKAYVLSGMVFVKNGATLTIEPGTIIYGDTGTVAGLCITPGAKINAVGTSNRPIVFTSVSPVGQRKPGDWFGVAIAGNAPINVTGGTAKVEGIESVSYGGNAPDDDSGIMKYVRIEYAGFKFNPTREANGLYLCGVGNRTVLDYLHFNANADDNIEFFGGTVNAKHIYTSNGNDDQLDWTEGYSGKIQFAVLHVFPNSEGNRGIEADNWENGFDNNPRSSPKIYNVTIVGPQQNYSEGEGKADHGLMLRRGTGGQLRNFIVVGYGRDAINIRDDATFAQVSSGGLVFDNAILFNNGGFGLDGVGNYGSQATKDALAAKSTRIMEVDPKLKDAYNTICPDYMPAAGSPALRIDVVSSPPEDGFFERVNFIGGVGPGHDWMQGGWIYVTKN